MKPEKLAPDNEVRQQIERDCRWQAAAFIEQSSTLLADAPALVKQIRERADKATAGPWDYCDSTTDEVGPRVWAVYPEADDSVEATIAVLDTGEHDNHANARFIAHAREDIPTLLTLLADAKRERDAALAEIVGLRNISKANIATMEGTVIRLNSYEKAHGELDLAIRETREVLSSPSPAFGVETGDRPCTCHPSEAPRPCPRMYALSDCQNAFGIALRLANGTLSWNACWEIAKAATAAVASFQFEPRSSGVERVIEAATIERCAKVAEARAASENAASARAYDAGRFGVSTCRDAGMEVAADIAKAIRALASLTGHGSYDALPQSGELRAQLKGDGE